MDGNLKNNKDAFDEINWTGYGPGQIQDRVASDVGYIIERLIKWFKPHSIILSGSFGKKEVSALIYDDEFHYFSDIEISIVSQFPMSFRKLKDASLKLSRKTGINAEIYHNLPQKYSGTLLKSIYEKKFITTVMYDRKYGSIVLYGRDYLSRLPEYKPADVPVWEGLRYLLNSMSHVLFFFNPFGDVELKGLEIYRALYRIHHIVSICEAALLTVVGQYHYSYTERARLFKKIITEQFPGLAEQLPEFPEAVDEALTAKLRPGKMHIVDIKYLWRRTQHICNTILRFILKQRFGIVFNSYAEFPDLYLAHPEIRKKYYQPPGRLIQCAINSKRIARLNGKSSFSILTGMFHPWSHERFATIPLAYFADIDDKARQLLPLRLQSVFGVHLENPYNMNETIECMCRLGKTLWG